MVIQFPRRRPVPVKGNALGVMLFVAVLIVFAAVLLSELF